MKHILILLISLTLYAESIKISLHQLANHVSESNHINIILDPKIDIESNFYFFSVLSPRISLNAFRIIISENGYLLSKLGNIYYLNKRPEKKFKFEYIKYNNIPYEKLEKLASFFNTELVNVGGSQIIVKYLDVDMFHNFKRYVSTLSEVKHVYLEGEIISVNEQQLEDIGIDFTSIASSINSIGSFDIGLFTNVNNNVAVQELISSRGINELGDVSFFINLLKESGAAHVVTRPNMMIMDNGTSVFKAGQEIRIVSSSTDSVRNSGEYSSKQYEMLDVGLTLDCSAKILNGHALLDFKFVISELIEYKPLLDVLVIGGHTFTSTFDIKDGEQIMLAGLTTSNDVTYNASVPYLSAVPLVGNLFNHDIDKVENISYIIYFKATIK
ncbi:MAG: hypothetical protein COB67_08880 [SAR324 cluster bacterium]|uniref:Type II/III secretion system secretin-like domain-containing protein n=1 Tax=SAR324 cluster bacterium TaxID=2024889 RepID=A0A2A4T165_9DELT|nr:MAG: hypothetical protein COB67_08880 [SAR324 cluster bacterium]